MSHRTAALTSRVSHEMARLGYRHLNIEPDDHETCVFVCDGKHTTWIMPPEIGEDLSTACLDAIDRLYAKAQLNRVWVPDADVSEYDLQDHEDDTFFVGPQDEIESEIEQ